MKYYTGKEAFIRVLLSSLILFAVVFLFYFVRYTLQSMRSEDPNYTIKVIAQRSHSNDIVPQEILAELFNLSIDQPTNLYLFNTAQAIKAVKNVGCFKKIKLSKIPPGILFVDYELRKPVAEIQDWENLGLDASGHFFFLYPFFSAKKLPKVFLGGVDDERIVKVMEFLKLESFFLNRGLRIKAIDMRGAYLLNVYRKIDMCFENSLGTLFFVRMRQENCKEAILRFLQILPLLPQEEQKPENLMCEKYILDLRIPSLVLYKKF